MTKYYQNNHNENIKLNKKVGADGILHLDIPVEMTDTEIEVTW
jgi:tryptophan synthase alpha subunit